MQARRSLFLTSFITGQYPLSSFRKIIFITLDIVENFLLTLETGFDNNSTSIVNYSEKYGSYKLNTNSKVESICINNIRSELKMKDFLEIYYNAYSSLNEQEKEIFTATFIDKMSDIEIIEKYCTHSVQIKNIRNSAIVRFCLKAGLDKFIDCV